MLICEITSAVNAANATADIALKNQAKQLKVKRAKLNADKARQRATAAQQRLQSAQTS